MTMIRKRQAVWLMVGLLTMFFAVSWLFAWDRAMAADQPEDPASVPFTEPFRVIGWAYLPQSENYGNEWGADVVLKVTYDNGYAEHDALYVVDWICFFELIVGKNALNDFVSVPYGPAGENYPDDWQRLLQIERTITP